ncbi:thioredoxin-like protein [Mycena sp. CBHHK59/15]|nr:thioredoxin-like protein [Mycena sp. CBHHK59/15]
MAILKLYSMKAATCMRRMVTILHELKVPFEFIEVDFQNGEHKTPAYMEKQPFGQIPYIDDNSLILYKTCAICRYIAAKHPSLGLIPLEPKANTLFKQAVVVESTNFDPSASKAGLQLFLRKLGWVEGDQTVIGAQLEILDKKIDVYNVILGKQCYVAGETFTLADLFDIPYTPLVASGGSDIMTQWPNVTRWYNKLVARCGWHMREEGYRQRRRTEMQTSRPKAGGVKLV